MAYIPLDPAVTSALINSQGTLATQATQSEQLRVAQNGTVIAQVTMNNTGTLATATNQTSQIALAQNGTSIALVTMNNQGTLATVANQSNQITLAQNGTSIAQVIMNNTGTLAKETTLTALRSDAAQTHNTYGATGTHASRTVAASIALNPDAASTDAFGRLRVSDPDYRFDGQLVYQINTDQWDTWFSTGGTITHDRTDRLAELVAPANGTAVFQSHYSAPYTPGSSQLAFTTFVAGTTPGYLGMRR